MNIEGWLCRHTATSSVTSSSWKIFFTHTLHMFFSFLISNWSYIEYIKIFAKWRNFEVSANFFVKTVTGSMLYQPVSQWHALHFELLIELVAQKLTELWWLKIWPIFLTGDLVPWPTYLSMSHTGTAHPFNMWTKFGDDMSKRSWVMLDKTDRLLDRQTDKPTNEHTCQKL